MKTYSSGLQRAEGREDGAEEAHRKQTCRVFYPFSASPSALLPHADPSGGGGHLVFRVGCIHAHTTSTLMHSHISAAHQILQLDEEYQWEQ